MHNSQVIEKTETNQSFKFVQFIFELTGRGIPQIELSDLDELLKLITYFPFYF